MSKVTVKSANLDDVRAEMKRRVKEQFEGEGFPTKCPKCSKAITVSASNNICKFCNAEFPAVLEI